MDGILKGLSFTSKPKAEPITEILVNDNSIVDSKSIAETFILSFPVLG